MSPTSVVAALRTLVTECHRAQFHSAGNLAKSVVIESAEMLAMAPQMAASTVQKGHWFAAVEGAS